jgi:hypothetical protein
MDCARARTCLRRGDAAPELDRDRALEHLDSCPECAAVGPSLDPLLLFRRMPPVAVSGEDAFRMRQAIQVLRRAPVDPAPPARTSVGLRLAAAIVAACALWLAPGPSPVGVGGAGPLELGSPASPEPARLAGPVRQPEFMPSVETISDAYVATQINEEDLTLIILANVDVAGQ